MTVHLDNGVPFGYELAHKDILYAPAVSITPDKAKVRVILSFRDIQTDLKDSEKVRRAIVEIREFCEMLQQERIIELIED